MRVDKNYCMSSYLAFRYIERDDKDFYEGIRHKNIPLIADDEKIHVATAGDISEGIENQLAQVCANKKVGVLLSGGMDSAIVASFAPGCDAYTFRFLGGAYQKEELSRAEYFAGYYGLKLHYVDITWEVVEQCVDKVMINKCCAVHSIEPQIYRAAIQAQNDGIELMLIGNGADYVFGGMDKLLSIDWGFEQFVRRYCSLNPAAVLQEPVDMIDAFEPFRLPGDKIDFQGFLSTLAVQESYSSYWNAFQTASMSYYDPYVRFSLRNPLDLKRIRNGESKYFIRELMAQRYPEISIPSKNPMPRPVDAYFSDWSGPRRKEFKRGLNMADFTGNQKWQMWCLERFLNLYEKE